MFPIFIPIQKQIEKIIPVEIVKTKFTDENGNKMIKWGDDENALVTFENADDWTNIVVKNLEKTLLTNNK